LNIVADLGAESVNGSEKCTKTITSEVVNTSLNAVSFVQYILLPSPAYIVFGSV
jgi:hypothetical protein